MTNAKPTPARSKVASKLALKVKTPKAKTRPPGPATAARWLVKSEPAAYSFAQLQSDGRTAWTGVRNFEARNNLGAMAKGDLCLFYHSVTEKAVVGVAEVLKVGYPDPTETSWVAVDLGPKTAFARPVTLAEIKASPKLAQMDLVRRSRLSVTPVTDADFAFVVSMGT